MIETLTQLLPTNCAWTIVFVLLVLCLTWDYRRRIGLPPGPYGLPFVGYMLFLDRSKMSQQLAALCREYRTDILSVVGPGQPLIALNNLDLMKEVFLKRTDVTDRREFGLFHPFDPEYSGVVGTSGKKWRETRRFSVSILRDFGMGKIGAEKTILEESRYLVDIMKSYNGKAFDPKDHINVAVSNIICGMVFGQRFQYDDQEFLQALDGMNALMLRLNSVPLFLALRSSIGRKIYKEKFNQCCNDYNKLISFVRKRIAEHRENYNGEVTDMIDAYLKEMELGHHPDVFDDKMLESLINDYFFAASETTHSTLNWCLLAVASYPEMQHKIQTELDQFIGSRTVSMNDKKHTPYSEAFISEVQRHYTLIQLGASHSNVTEDVTINGYRIPRNSMVVGNIDKIHHDRQIWKNPEQFDPENFLENGKVVNLDKLLPFSIGRRACPGEPLAKMELYIFLTSLVKEFDMRLEDDEEELMSGIMAAVYKPKPFKIRVKNRNKTELTT